MTTRFAAVLAVLLVLAACASGGTSEPDPGPSPYAPDDVVVQVAWTGGFVTPQMLAARLPLVTVYGDGRVITEGPVPAIYPGPALPNLLVARIDEGTVQDLADRALDAGVGETTDLGAPPIADAPSTRFTVSTGLETIVREVYALSEVGADGGGLTDDQVAARDRLSAFRDELTELSAGASASYAATAVGALATEYVAPEEPEPPQPDVAWPGPELPGEPVAGPLGLSCVVATGDQAGAVLDTAATANQLTPWVAADGSRWSLVLRPLLPHESGCADLQQG